jgi:hypothetical protein
MLNIIGNIQDSINTLSGNNRKFVFNAGSFDAKNEMWTADLLEIIPIPKTFTDWFLPSKDELNEMRVELFLNSVGDFQSSSYWSSTQSTTYPLGYAWAQNFGNGTPADTIKSGNAYVRPIRSFVSTKIYSKRQTGPAGGLIFLIQNMGGEQPFRYYEAAPTNIVSTHAWSNITNLSVSTSSDIGTGYQNTLNIIAQPGHSSSSALLCRNLSISL